MFDTEFKYIYLFFIYNNSMFFYIENNIMVKFSGVLSGIVFKKVILHFFSETRLLYRILKLVLVFLMQNVLQLHINVYIYIFHNY